ncbi:unnamed protein product, partial [Brenthis ino]
MENMYQAPRDGEQLAPPPLDGQDAQARSLTHRKCVTYLTLSNARRATVASSPSLTVLRQGGRVRVSVCACGLGRDNPGARVWRVCVPHGGARGLLFPHAVLVHEYV